MNAFHFGLERVLGLRRRQLEAAEGRFRRQAAALGELDATRAALESAAAEAERAVRRWPAVSGWDLAALAEFRRHASARQQALLAQRAESERNLAARQREMLEARRSCRLLERLKERRWAEWREAANRELEDLAAESYLARWNRNRSP